MNSLQGTLSISSIFNQYDTSSENSEDENCHDDINTSIDNTENENENDTCKDDFIMTETEEEQKCMVCTDNGNSLSVNCSDEEISYTDTSVSCLNPAHPSNIQYSDDESTCTDYSDDDTEDYNTDSEDCLSDLEFEEDSDMYTVLMDDNTLFHHEDLNVVKDHILNIALRLARKPGYFIHMKNLDYIEVHYQESSFFFNTDTVRHVLEIISSVKVKA